MVIPRFFSSGALSISSYFLALARFISWRTQVIAAIGTLVPNREFKISVSLILAKLQKKIFGIVDTINFYHRSNNDVD
ncbi:hypothetical protein BpHYR1_037955 [Brachionus plicatilis]|uniref:Uncharacterized protein n=1 Tax=Brachionus plicatilis TaxID=10195 RepID=A0A3M7QE15_BRAPC|nr:hypothetical protein BpHYR1_037955 [Brachionus plicatilis]